MSQDNRASEILGELAGSASLCWTPKPTGVFDSSSAIIFVDTALSELRSLVKGLKSGNESWVLYDKAIADVLKLLGEN